jgi:hypothetical protein
MAIEPGDDGTDLGVLVYVHVILASKVDIFLLHVDEVKVEDLAMAGDDSLTIVIVVVGI